MSSPLAVARVAFDAEEHVSSEVDLAAYQVRGLFSPQGHALGNVTLETRINSGDPYAKVPLELADNDEDATLLAFEKDWPLWLTTVTVENPRAECFELFFLVEHRG